MSTEPETILSENSSVFDQEAIANWVELCNEHGRLRAAGAEQEVLNLLRVQIVMGMTDMLPNITNNERTALALFLLAPMMTETISLDVPAVADPVHEETSSVIDEPGDEVNNVED